LIGKNYYSTRQGLIGKSTTREGIKTPGGKKGKKVCPCGNFKEFPIIPEPLSKIVHARDILAVERRI
jgi:hypothetical protein